jgi:hypothetical protein
MSYLSATISDYVHDYNEIELTSKPIPELQDGHVLVKLSINPLDYKVDKEQV